MRSRVEAFERVIIQARRDPPGTKNWKEQHIGIGESERELEEEKKVEEVFVHRWKLKSTTLKIKNYIIFCALS